MDIDFGMLDEPGEVSRRSRSLAEVDDARSPF